MGNMAQDYADGIRDGIEAWDMIRDAWNATGDPITARDALDGRGGPVGELARRMADEVDAFATCDNYGSAAAVWSDDMADEWTVATVRPGIAPEITAAHFLATGGGPHAEIIADADNPERVTVRVWWGTDEGTARIISPIVSEAAAALIERVEENY